MYFKDELIFQFKKTFYFFGYELESRVVYEHGEQDERRVMHVTVRVREAFKQRLE